jgi:putative ABC transport system permease protein
MFVQTILDILAHLFRHRARTLLTMTGLAVGVFALTLVGSLGETFHKTMVLQEEATYQSLRVWPARWDRPLTSTTRRALRRVPGVAGTLARLWARLADPESEESSSEIAAEWVWASDSDLPDLEYGPPLVTSKLLRGHLPTATNEALLDFDLAQAHGWEVGDTIPIQDRPFVVAGILERPPLASSRSAYIDYQTLHTLMRMPSDYLQYLDVIPDPGQDPTELAARIQEQLPEVSVRTPEQEIADARQGFSLFGLIAGASAGLALLGGTLTIINTLLMNVRERQAEIGLKKALGATDGDILLEFLLEAGTLGVLGGIMGVLLAWFLTLGVNQFVRARWGLSLLSLTPRLVLGAMAFSTLLGALAGSYPAWRAARQDPVQALRNAPAVLYAERGFKRFLYLVGRRARWLLTVGGISAGIIVLTVALSLAEFLNHYTQSAVEATHDRIGLYVRRDPQVAYTTTLRELRRVEGVRGVVTMVYGGRLFESGQDPFGLISQNPTLVGMDSPTGEFGFNEPSRASIAHGRFLIPDSLREVVLGPRLAESLGLGVGDALDVRGRDFTVVGIWDTSPYDTLASYSFNAYVTIAALRSLSPNEPVFPDITVLVGPGTDPEALAARLREAMPEWTVRTGRSAAEEIRQVMTIFTLVLIGYVSMGLLAGGLSVMNTMVMAVTNRTREIGLKKAVGAGDGDVLAEVVEESGWVGLLGGALGVAAGWLLAVGVNTFTERTDGVRLLMVTPRLVVVALVFTTFLGMVAGLYPAWRASRVDPIQALRSE